MDSFDDVRKSMSKVHNASPRKEGSVKSTNAVTFPVIALGASAVGLEALRTFFETMPGNSEMAFVVIHHADPDHKSLMAEILDNHTTMSVVLAQDKTPVRASTTLIDQFRTLQGRNSSSADRTTHGTVAYRKCIRLPDVSAEKSRRGKPAL